MDWYGVFKFLHIVSAVCWVGGGVVLMYLGILGVRANDDDATMRVVQQTASLALRWFMPFALGTVIFGIVATALVNAWAEAWIILGLVGFAATFVTGNFFVRPIADAIAKAESEGKRDIAVANGRKLLKISQFDYVMLFTVIADMVFKPQWSDILPLAIMAIVVVGGAVLFLRPAVQQKLVA